MSEMFARCPAPFHDDVAVHVYTRHESDETKLSLMSYMWYSVLQVGCPSGIEISCCNLSGWSDNELTWHS